MPVMAMWGTAYVMGAGVVIGPAVTISPFVAVTATHAAAALPAAGGPAPGRDPAGVGAAPDRRRWPASSPASSSPVGRGASPGSCGSRSPTGAAAVAGVLLALGAFLASGSLGDLRLAYLGPLPPTVGILGAVLIVLGAAPERGCGRPRDRRRLVGRERRPGRARRE